MFAALLTLTLVVSADDLPKLTEAGQKELKKLEGKWKAEKITAYGGEEMTMMDGADVILTFKDRSLLLNGKEVLGVSALDPSTDPKIIDFKSLIDMAPIQKGTVYEGIYKLDGDTLTIALYIGAGNKRPEKLESPKDSSIVLVTLKREKK